MTVLNPFQIETLRAKVDRLVAETDVDREAAYETVLDEFERDQAARRPMNEAQGDRIIELLASMNARLWNMSRTTYEL